MRKVSRLAHDLAAQGLLCADEARRLILVAALEPTLVEADQAVTGESLLSATGLSAAAVSEELERLRAQGFAVEHAGRSGYRLTQPFDDLLVPEAALVQIIHRMDFGSTTSVGLPYRYQQRCVSTNLELKKEAAFSPSGTLLVTDDQTRGRGRLGRSWVSGPGQDLTFSLLLRPRISPERAPLLSLVTALATTEALESLPGLLGRVSLKWPNDVLVDGKKVCGILLESFIDGESLGWVVIGIGLNVNSDPGSYLEGLEVSEREVWRGRPRPTSLLVELGREVARGRLLADLLAGLATLLPEVATPALLERIRARDALYGRRLQVFAGPPDGALVVAGEGAGVGPRGELLVRDSEGRIVPVFAGEVTLSVDS